MALSLFGSFHVALAWHRTTLGAFVCCTGMALSSCRRFHLLREHGLKLVCELSCVALAWQSEGHLSLIGVQRFLQSAVSAKPLRNFQGKNEINHKTFHFKPNSAVCFPMREKTAPRYLERTSWCERRPYSLIGMTCVYVSRPFLFRAMCLNLSDSGHGDFER